jgi:hypothetical protein
MFGQLKDTLFPVTGGALGSIFSMISFHGIVDTIIIACIGGAIGYLVKWVFDWFRYDILKKKKYEHNS